MYLCSNIFPIIVEKDRERESCLAVILFTVFMNTAGFSVSPLLKVVSFRCVAVISTLLQVLGLAICALTVTGHFCWTLLGFGVLVGSGVGITFINNIVISHKTFPKSLTLVFGKISADDRLQSTNITL